MKVTTKFVKELQSADSEKLVESLYHQELRRSIENMKGTVKNIKTAFKTDGVIDAEIGVNGQVKYLRILLEAKYNENFDNPVVRSKVLAQVVAYLKKFDNEGESLPSVILVGDKNECFVVHSNLLMKYLIGDYQWELSPSMMYKDEKLVLDLTMDNELQKACFVYLINDEFNFDDVLKKITDLFLGTKVKVQITDRSISKVFDYFTLRILKKKSDGTAKYEPREQREFFMSLVMDTKNCYIHPNKKDKAKFNELEVDVNEDAFNSFLEHYTFQYNQDEKKRFSEVCDRLIEDADRRFRGDFYTPSIWVDEAHKMVGEHLGTDWRQEYMVWDCASGTKNLTRDYKFFELYSSSLGEDDLEIGKEYNKEGIAFQYDFLSDDVEFFDELLTRVQKGEFLNINDFKDSKLYKYAPSLVQGLLNGKKLLFLINPPYGTNAEISNKGEEGKTKAGIANNKVNQIMKENKVGACSQQLYAQFLYRINDFVRLFGKNIYIGLFSPPTYLSSSYFNHFRKSFLSSFHYNDGMLFQASNFADVASNWGISFTILTPNNSNIVQDKFTVSIKDLLLGSIQKVGEKIIYNVDIGNSCSNWIKEDIKKLKGQDAPQMKSAINVGTVKKNGTLVKNSLGYYYNQSNIVQENSMNVCLYSSCASHGHGISILPINFERVISNFTARKLFIGQYSDWINSKDEYMIPNIKHENYQQWENDSIIYSLFNTASNQSSLRNIQYNQKSWDIINHFFFMSEQEIKDLSQGKKNRATINNEVEQDIQNHGGDRFVYNKIKTIESVKGFSDDAQKVLDKARELVTKSFKYRTLFAQTNPEYHVETWDAGWYQIKGLLKEYMKDELKEFNELYKLFEDRLRPLVYELGFLYQ